MIDLDEYEMQRVQLRTSGHLTFDASRSVQACARFYSYFYGTLRFYETVMAHSAPVGGWGCLSKLKFYGQ